MKIDFNCVRKTSYSARIHHTDFFVTTHLQNFIEQKINTLITSGMFVADIGCGEQPLRRIIEARGARYFSIDISQNSFKNVDVVASMTEMPVQDNLFDCILCTEVLEHISDTDAAFSELTRVLKPGGICILTTPFLYRLHEEPYDHVRLTIHGVKHFALHNNLQIMELSKTGNELEVAATLLNYLLRAEHSNVFSKILSRISTIFVNVSTLVACRFLSLRSPAGYLNTVAVLVKAA